jgi:hypothetical protein
MVNPPDDKVNPILVNEARFSFLQFYPAYALLRARNPPPVLASFLPGIEFEMAYARVLAGNGQTLAVAAQAGGATPAPGPTLLTPWRDGYGKNFWGRYVPDKKSNLLWRSLVPFEYDLTQEFAALTLPDCTVVPHAYLYPWGIGILIDITLTGPLPLNDAVTRILKIRNRPAIQWTAKTPAGADPGAPTSGTASPAGLATEIRRRLGETLYGDKVEAEDHGAPFTLVTITDAQNVSFSDPIAEGGDIHRALEGLTGFNDLFSGLWKQPNSAAGLLAKATVSFRRDADGHILYGKPRARAVWFPARFRSAPTSSYADTLSCYHQNLSIATLHTESLCGFAQNVAAALDAEGSFSDFSATYVESSRLTAGILGRLHGDSTDEVKDNQKPEIYRSGSLRAQILTYAKSIQQLRAFSGMTPLAAAVAQSPVSPAAPAKPASP